jgi:hypothetical protein
MSWDLYDWRDAVTAAVCDKRISPTVAYTAFALTKYAHNETGEFFPKQETMSSYMGVPVSTLRRHLRELESADLLETVTTQHGIERVWSKNEYRLTMPDLRSSVSAGGTTDLRSSVGAGQGNQHDLRSSETRPPLIPDTTSAHLEHDLRPPVSDIELTSELTSELTREQKPVVANSQSSPGEHDLRSSVSAGRKAPEFVSADAATQVRQPPLMQAVPDLPPELDDRGRETLGRGVSKFHEAIEYLNDHRPVGHELNPAEERDLRDALRARTSPDAIFEHFTVTGARATA